MEPNAVIEAVQADWLVTVAKLLAGAAGASVIGLIVIIFQQKQIRSLQGTLQKIVLQAMAPHREHDDG